MWRCSKSSGQRPSKGRGLGFTTMLVFDDQQDGCLEGHMPWKGLGRWVVPVLLFEFVLILTVLSKGRENLGEYL